MQTHYVTLADHFRAYKIWTHCKCGRECFLDMPKLAREWGWDTPFELIERRLRCVKCKERPRFALLVKMAQEQVEANRVIVSSYRSKIVTFPSPF